MGIGNIGYPRVYTSYTITGIYAQCVGCKGLGFLFGGCGPCPYCGGTGKAMVPRVYLSGVEENREMLHQLKNLNLERGDVDELVSLAAFGRTMEKEYEHFGAEAPDWLTDNLKELRREVRQRLQDTLESRLVEINSRLDSLSTVEEKREKLRQEAERLKVKLGKSGGATA